MVVTEALVPSSFQMHRPAQATLFDVRETMVSLKSWMSAIGLAQDDISGAEIVVAEVLNNVIKHAQNGCDTGWFELKCTVRNDALYFSCRDNGAEMPGGAPPGGTLPSVDLSASDLPEGGWGWSLVRALCSDLKYERLNDENLVTFRLVSTRIG